MPKNFIAIVHFLCAIIFLQLPVYALDNIEKFDIEYQYSKIDKNAQGILPELQTSVLQSDLSIQQRYFLTHNLAHTHFRLNDKSAAIDTYTKSILLAEQLSNYHQAKSLWRRAMTYGILFRDTDTAILDLDSALKLVNSAKNKDSYHTLTASSQEELIRLNIDLLTSMAQAYNQKAELTKASDYINEAITLASEPIYKEDKIYALVILGRIYWQQTKIQDAASTYLYALKLTDTDTPPRRIASIELRLANIYLSQKIFNQSLIHAQKSVDIYQTLNNPRMQIKSISLLADIHFEIDGNIDIALMHYLNALDIAIQNDAPHSIGELRHLIGKTYLKANDLQLAENYLKTAKQILEKSEEHYYVGLNDIELARLQQKLGDTLGAINALESLSNSERLTPYPDSIHVANNLLVSLYAKTKQYDKAYDIQSLLLETERASQRLLNDNFVNQLTNEITVKSLLLEKDTLVEKNKEIQTKLADEAHSKYFYLSVIFILFIFTMIILRQLRTTKNRERSYKKNYTMTWSFFWQQIENVVNHANIKQEKKSSAGILVSFPTVLLNPHKEANKFDENRIMSEHHDDLLHNILHTSHVCYHDEIWLNCPSKPIISESLISALKEKSNHMSVKLIWFGFDNLPEHISADTLIMIQKLIYKIGTEYEVAANTQYASITLATNALHIIFNNADHSADFSIDKGIDTACQSGTVKVNTVEI